MPSPQNPRKSRNHCNPYRTRDFFDIGNILYILYIYYNNYIINITVCINVTEAPRGSEKIDACFVAWRHAGDARATATAI